MLKIAAQARHHRKYTVILSLTIGLGGSTALLQAYEPPLLSPLPAQNLLLAYRPGSYELGNNPAFFSQNYPDNLSSYRLTFAYQETPVHRTFDPTGRRDYRLLTYNINHLSEQTTLGAFIDYQRADLRHMYRSLEKDFYGEYFALADTTTGNTTFDGPQVGFLYNYIPNSTLSTGFKIDYGVEHGIKDVFTKCETIMRNIDLSGGVGLSILDRRVQLGIVGRYFNGQRKYEAVKELQDAQVKTYFGYHVYKLENPRTTNRKNDNRQGYEIGGQLIINRLGLDGLQGTLTLSQAAKSIAVSVGSVSSPEERGYGLSTGQRLLVNLAYTSKRQNYLALLYAYSQNMDWVEGATFKVIVLENQQACHQVRLTSSWQPFKKLQLNGLLDLQTIQDDYTEYVQYFRAQAERYALSGLGEIRWRINPIHTGYCRGQLSKEEPFFYWNTAWIQTTRLAVGIERIGIFGKVGLDLEFGQQQAAQSSDQNHLIGININYQR